MSAPSIEDIIVWLKKYDAERVKVRDLVTALRVCERALSHNSLGAMDEEELASARFAARVALGRHEDTEVA